MDKYDPRMHVMRVLITIVIIKTLTGTVLDLSQSFNRPAVSNKDQLAPDQCE